MAELDTLLIHNPMEEAIEVKKQFIEAYGESEKRVLLSDEMDPNNAIISINAGAGGTESCDWAAMLHRMIIKWAEKKGETSIKEYWKDKNQVSLDGKPTKIFDS